MRGYTSNLSTIEINDERKDLSKMPTPGYVFRDGGPVPDDELEPKSVDGGPSSFLQMIRPSSGSTQSPTTGPPSTSTGSPMNTPTSSKSTLNPTTDSHALANADHDEKGAAHYAPEQHSVTNTGFDDQGAAQLGHNEPEVKDLGWNEHPQDVPKPLVGGLPNEELWLLVRRFNKVLQYLVL